MLHARDAISFRDGRRVVHSAVLAVLTMAAMLLCVLAVHSAGHGLGQAPGHSMSAVKATTAVATVTATTAGAHSTNSAATHTASSGAPLSADRASPVSGALLERIAPATATVAATATVTALAVGVISIADNHSLSGGATLSMMCSLLLVLGGLILLSRRPSAFRRLLEAGGFIVGSFREIPLHLRRPSLTLLSISRI
jgi:hypothetical protein